ncbi:MAG: DUF929 family protein [Candidatus Micrarchaeota archaeon]|nr:DUF929 family protein [Candidatus Micrarchaeota archaeon]
MAARNRGSASATIKTLQKRNRQLKYVSVGLAIAVVLIGIYSQTSSINVAINGQPFGQRLTGINNPLTPQQLSVINNASDANFETAGMMLLNGSLPGEFSSGNTSYGVIQVVPTNQIAAFTANGKPSVIYIGAISCVYCGESRWAMSLALSRFGSFNSLYTGYSSLGDGDVPSLYWKQNNITNATVTYGSSFSSRYINFIAAEYDSPITAGFQLPNLADPLQYYIQNAPNATYSSALMYMDRTGLFSGTPFTLWGRVADRGAVSSVFGPTSKAATNTPGITFMTQAQILDQLKSFNTTLALQEYAGADVYAAQVCPSINNAAPICSLPAIKSLEANMGLA